MAFTEVRGQHIAVRMLEHELAGDRLPQTLLFYGPEGCGKFLTALELVKLLNCQDNQPLGSRGSCSCPSCTAVQNLASRNIFFISKAPLTRIFELWKESGFTEKHLPALRFDLKRVLLSISDEGRFSREYEALQEFVRIQNGVEERFDEILETVLSMSTAMEGSIIGIDSIREVQRFLSLKSGEGEHRCVIIDAAEHMNVEASNCFLKISEDTPAGAVIILIATRRESIQETIRSRCRAYRFLPLSEELSTEIVRDRFGILPKTESSTKPLYYRDMAAAHEDPHALNRAVKEIAEGGDAVSFLDYTVHLLQRAIPELQNRSIDEVQDVEGLLKRADHVKTSIVQFHANVETALTDFLLSSGRKILRYIS